MTRPVDWSPLAGSDPVPGDPGRVSSTGTRCRNAAAEIRQQVAALRRLSTADGWEAEAAEAFRSAGNDAAGKLEQAEARYATVAGALLAYAPALEAAQDRSLAALLEAQAAELEASVAAVAAPTGSLPANATPEQQDARVASERRAGAAADAAADRMRVAFRMLADAQADRDQAARTAADRIREVVNDDGLKDSRWEKVKNWAADAECCPRWLMSRHGSPPASWSSPCSSPG